MSLRYDVLQNQQHHKGGQVMLNRPHQLAGRRFDEFWLTGELHIPTNESRRRAVLQEVQVWLMRLEGCIRVGDLRVLEPNGPIWVKPSAQPQVLYIRAQVLSAQDIRRLYNAIEQEASKMKGYATPQI